MAASTASGMMVGMAGFEPAQCETPDLQSGPTLQLWRIPW